MNRYLDGINSPHDLKKLDMHELETLCGEIRQFLIDSVSKTGGHIASNLGVVELTVALHYVFNCPKDKIIWDVGHQSYVHKILTGRRERMNTLRQLNGMSGFPKREESEFDVFDTGHSSTSISAAIGIARARDLKEEDYEVVAVIGDGALTGGMAFEALNDAGRSSTKMIVVLNDNEMSISPNVGGLSRYLSKIRTEPRYLSTKKDVEKLLDSMPGIGRPVKAFLKKLKDGIKKMVVTGGMLFEELGFTYMGPVNGHSMDELCDAFEKAQNAEGPVLIHVRTTKGKGYKFAEDNPNDFHGVAPFDIETGKALTKSSKPSYSAVFGKKMCEIASKNPNVVAITAAMTDGTGLTEFSVKFPDRLYDIGIAEQHAVTMAAGLAANGIVPVVALYSSFLQRAYDQVVHDVAIQNLHVVLAIDRAGLVGSDGETHQGILDSAFLWQIPNMTVMAPADYREFESMLQYAVDVVSGPVCVRYPRGSSRGDLPNSDVPIELGKGVIVREGSDVTVVACGKMVAVAADATDILSSFGIAAEVVNLRFLKPLDEELIFKSVSKTGRVIIIDETVKDGSISYKIFKSLPQSAQVIVRTLPDKFIKQGSVDELLKANGLDADSIADAVVKLMLRK